VVSKLIEWFEIDGEAKKSYDVCLSYGNTSSQSGASCWWTVLSADVLSSIAPAWRLSLS
jgi:hypothetical protein